MTHASTGTSSAARSPSPSANAVSSPEILGCVGDVDQP